jgi:long-chain acyl-CoA synthetase
MSKEFFDAHFHPQRHRPGERFTNSLNYLLSTLFFNAFPIPQRETGAGQSIRYMGELTEGGYSILIFPEGDRTRAGEIRTFQPGVGMIASHLHVPVVPIRIKGLEKVLHRDAKFPRMGRVEVAIGEPMLLQGAAFGALAAQVEEAVKKL